MFSSTRHRLLLATVTVPCVLMMAVPAASAQNVDTPTPLSPALPTLAAPALPTFQAPALPVAISPTLPTLDEVNTQINQAIADAQVQAEEQMQALRQHIAEQISAVLPPVVPAAPLDAEGPAVEEGIAGAVPAAPALLQPADNYSVKPAGPNYRTSYLWQDQLLAGNLINGKFEGVLHRVQGSFFNAPDIPQESLKAEARGKSLFGPGTPLYVGTENICTLGVAGVDAKGNKVGITAGHCGEVGEKVYSADSFATGAHGTIVASNADKEYAVIKFDDKSEVTSRYNGLQVNTIGGGIVDGQQLSKLGVATNFTSGPSWMTADGANLSQVCAFRGDSGAPLMAGNRMVGMIVGGFSKDLPCVSPLQGMIHTPTLSVTMDKVMMDLESTTGVGRGFRLPEAP